MKKPFEKISTGNCISSKSTSTRRIGIDAKTNEYVIFDQTIGNEFHAHARTWDQLHEEMRCALIDAGLVTRKGKIL